MKNWMKSTLFAVTLAVLGAALAVAPAQAESGARVMVNIPFDFSVGNAPLKAGSYMVEELQSGVLAFTSDDRKEHLFALSVHGQSSSRRDEPRLVFTRYGREAFLSQAFLSAGADSDQLPQSSREKKLIQDRAAGEEVSLLIQPAR